MSLKSKSRGSMLMVSDYLSEWRGRLRCTQEQAVAYATEFPASLIAQKLSDRAWNFDARLILEPGAGRGKDKYFDGDQLVEQQKLAMEVFEASHVAPARTVAICEQVPISLTVGPEGVEAHAEVRLVAKELPAVRCRGLWLFDNSSGHGKTAPGARNAGACNKGPDWTGKVVPMRDGWYTKLASDEHGKQYVTRVAQRMQFQRGDVLPCDLVVPAGLDPDAAVTGEARRPQILPEQLFGRQVVTTLSDGLGIPGWIISEPREPDEDGNEQVAIEWDDEEMVDTLATVAEVLEMLVGPPPDPEQHQEAPPTVEETQAAFEKFFAGRSGTLKKYNPGKGRTELRELAQAEWPKLTEERRLHFVRKVRTTAQPGAAAAAERTISAGQPVPPALWGRHKGSEVLLAERGLLPLQPLRGACSSEKGERLLDFAPQPHSHLHSHRTLYSHPHCLHNHSHPPTLLTVLELRLVASQRHGFSQATSLPSTHPSSSTHASACRASACRALRMSRLRMSRLRMSRLCMSRPPHVAPSVCRTLHMSHPPPVLRARPVKLHALQCTDARSALGARPPLPSARR